MHSNPLNGAGIGLRHQHLSHVLNTQPSVPWFEVHTENYFAQGSQAAFILDVISQRTPLSCHGVGLSLGSASGVDEVHLSHVKQVIDRYKPALVSDHVSWGKVGNVHLCDLLPIPYTHEALKVMVQNISHVQDVLKRPILIENPSTYLQFKHAEMTEWEFLNALTKQAGCGLLLDVNNVYVSCQNHGWSAQNYISSITKNTVGELHLAGHTATQVEGQTLLIDDHGSHVNNAVWELYRHTIQHVGDVPTLLEWDTDVPDFSELEAERLKAEEIMMHAHA